MKASEFKKLIREEVRKVLKEENVTKHFVTIQISDPADQFEVPDDYSIPTAVKAVVGPPEFTADPDYDEEDYDEEIDAYIHKLEKALLDLGKKVVPGMKEYTIEDGAIIFELPSQPSAQIESKLKALYKGAKSVEF